MDVLESRDRFSVVPETQSAESNDFVSVLRRRGALARPVTAVGPPAITETQATTILAFKFADGVLVAGDRRATAGNVVMYDRADKVLEIDRHSLMAILSSKSAPGDECRGEGTRSLQITSRQFRDGYPRSWGRGTALCYFRCE